MSHLHLVSDNLPPTTMQLMARLALDARMATRIPIEEVRTHYANIEYARDLLSAILDKADRKNV